ncbi:MAG: hypothetical protein AAGB23_02855 [Pseudomonadota bacterium]
MSNLPDEFQQDLALRDAARAVLVADIEHARTSMTGKAIAGRVTGRIGDGAKDVLEVAKIHATEQRGVLAGIVALIALWFAREPLFELFSASEPSNEADSEQEEASSPLDASEAEAENEEDAEPEVSEPPFTGENHGCNRST